MAEKIKIGEIKQVSSTSEFNHYIMDVNGHSVKVYSKKNGGGFGMDSKELAKAFNYNDVEKFKKSQEWESFNNLFSPPTLRSAKVSEIEELELRNQLKQEISNSSPAFWAGGTFEDAVENTAKTIIRMDGSAQFGGGTIQFHPNGSGYIANQGIVWDAVGNLLVTGKYMSALGGKRIEIDPINNNLAMTDTNGEIIAMLDYDNDNLPQFQLKNPVKGGERITLRSNLFSQLGGVFVVQSPDVWLPHLPTEKPEQKGALWRDGEFVKVVV